MPPPAAPGQPVFLPGAVAAAAAVGRGLYISRRAWMPQATHVARSAGVGQLVGTVARRALHGLFGARLQQAVPAVLPADVLD
jgi:hypothetical protein